MLQRPVVVVFMTSTSKRRSTHLLFQQKPYSQQLLAKQP